jgi:hypothetical protein
LLVQEPVFVVRGGLSEDFGEFESKLFSRRFFSLGTSGEKIALNQKEKKRKKKLFRIKSPVNALVVYQWV